MHPASGPGGRRTLSRTAASRRNGVLTAVDCRTAGLHRRRLVRCTRFEQSPCTRNRHLGTDVTQRRATDDGAAVVTSAKEDRQARSVKYDAPYVFYVHAKGQSPVARCPV